MENSCIEHPCIFEWNIYNPFLPWESMEATFYSCTRTLTQWRAIIRPMGRGINDWIFSFSLKAEEFDEFDIIRALRVQVDISINERTVAKERVENFVFEYSNHQTFYFETHAVMRPTLDTPLLVIRIEIYLPGLSPRVNASGISLHQEDQMQLSQDLYRLLNSHRYYNMMLAANDEHQNYHVHVHSCILDARWNNFFEIHSDDNALVEVNFSLRVLWDILTYMYSGSLRITRPDWERGSNMGGLFEVIDMYKLYSLYKVFVKNDAQQLRETSKDLATYGYNFALDSIASRTWEVPVLFRNHVFHLCLRILIDEANITLSYLLRSAVDSNTYVQVNLQFVKRTQPALRYLSLHERDYNVDEFGIVQSGDVSFQRNAEIFKEFRFGEDLDLACLLHFSDGTSLIRVGDTIDNTLQNDLERFSVLGDDMHALLITGRRFDLRIRCLNDRNVYIEYLVHKAVFTARVPKYWRVLQNVPREGEIPAIVTCTVRSEAFRHVLVYIYTGKILCFPLPFIDEVYHFAQLTEFDALLRLINRMRVG